MQHYKRCTNGEQHCNNKRLTKDQVRLLEASFKFSSKLDTDRKTHLAQQLGLTDRQVAIWYQNKRARSKNQGLEKEYKALKQRHETTLAKITGLEKEVQSLKEELDKAHKMLVSSQTSSSNNNNTNKICGCDQHGNFVGERCCMLENELYACFVCMN